MTTQISINELKALATIVAKADKNGLAFRCVHLNGSEMVATDGRVLAILDFIITLDEPVSIPLDTINKITPERGAIVANLSRIDGDVYELDYDGVVYKFTSVRGFPDYKRLLPTRDWTPKPMTGVMVDPELFAPLANINKSLNVKGINLKFYEETQAIVYSTAASYGLIMPMSVE